MDTSVNPRPARQPAPETKYAVRMGKEHLFFISSDTFANFPDVTCFEVVCEDDRILLIPPREKLPSWEEVQDKITNLGITEEDVAVKIAEVRN